MSEARIVCQFSCGAASAVATKLILAKYPAEQVSIVNAFIVEEHEDNRRFLADCEKWLGREITVLRDEKYGASTDRVWAERRYMKGQYGAPCSKHLKRDLLNNWALPDDIYVLGYTVEEQDRLDQFIDSNNGRKVITPLIEANLTHSDCLAMVERAGLVLPEMYLLGFSNANCMGCVKGGEGYFNKVRRVFPNRFHTIMAIQESIGPGSYFFRNRKTNERFGLKDLDPEAGRDDDSSPSCSFFCAMAEADIAQGAAGLKA